MTNQNQLAAMLKFAQLHDWGNQALIPANCDALHVYDNYTNQIVVFHDMQSLKQWAGY
jgi:hypothetical protein